MYIVEKIHSYELCADVPQYKKLDIIHCLLCLIPNPYDSTRQYLKRRKEHNKKYKEFWDKADKITFNDDKSEYLFAHLTQAVDVKENNIIDNEFGHKYR